MKKSLLIFLLLLLIVPFQTAFAQGGYYIYTVAGNKDFGYSGDGGPAIDAELTNPSGVCTDAYGNFYVADCYNNRIRKVNNSGIITTFAGNGIFGYSGDGGPATDAELSNPMGIAIDSSGNMYIADIDANRIRKVNTSGIITTFAGNGTIGDTGTGGPAINAELNAPYDVAIDRIGNVYIADYGNARICKVNTVGILTTFAGITGTYGYSGDGGPATDAEIRLPLGVATDGSNNVYIADRDNNRIRKVNTLGIITTIAGKGYFGGYSGDGGPATAAELNSPTGIAVDNLGNIYIADEGNSRIREINASGIITTFAGNGMSGYSGNGGLATAAKLAMPFKVAVDGSFNVYITDYQDGVVQNGVVRKVIYSYMGITDVNKNGAQIKIYPNPANALLNVQTELTKGETENICLYNTLGQKVKCRQLTANCTAIAVSNLAEGVYLYRLTDAQGTLLKEDKVMLVH